MNKRILSIIYELCRSDSKISIGSLADKYNVSQRTIRNDLHADRDFYTYKLSKEERVNVAISLLVNSAGYITLSAIADSLFVSRATVINDLESIKKYVKAANLEVLSHPNKGIRVDGTERKVLFQIVDGGYRKKRHGNKY